MGRGSKTPSATGGIFKKGLGDLIRPADKVDTKGGGSYGAPWQSKSVQKNKDIDATLKKVNPKYNPKDTAYSENCTSVTQAYELRRRGQDVKAGPLETKYRSDHGGTGGRGLDFIASRWGRNFTPANSKAEVEQAFKAHGDGARGIVGVLYKQGGGHVFNVENVGGNVRFIDAQPNPGVPHAASNFANAVKIDHIRLDDLKTPSKMDMRPVLDP